MVTRRFWLILALCWACTFAADRVVRMIPHRLSGPSIAPHTASVQESASGPHVQVDSVSSGVSHPGGNAKGPIKDRMPGAFTGASAVPPLPGREVLDFQNFRENGHTTALLSNAEKRQQEQEVLRSELERLQRYDRLLGWFAQGAHGSNTAGNVSAEVVTRIPPAAQTTPIENILNKILPELTQLVLTQLSRVFQGECAGDIQPTAFGVNRFEGGVVAPY